MTFSVSLYVLIYNVETEINWFCRIRYTLPALYVDIGRFTHRSHIKILYIPSIVSSNLILR